MLATLNVDKNRCMVMVSLEKFIIDIKHLPHYSQMIAVLVLMR